GFEVDFTLHTLTGLVVMSGRSCGSENRRTRQMLAASAIDDIGLVVNLSGPFRVLYRGKEVVLGDGDAMMVSFEEVCSFTHLAPGGLLALRVPRGSFAPLVNCIDDRCGQRVPHTTPALRLLINYLKMAQDTRCVANSAIQQLIVSHTYDLIAT